MSTLGKLRVWAIRLRARLGRWLRLGCSRHPPNVNGEGGEPHFTGFETFENDVDAIYPAPGNTTGGIRGLGQIAHTDRAYKVIRNAAIDLFYYYDFDLIPAQFWPLLERTRDPVTAFRKLLKAFGCDVELVRIHDAEEKKKASAMLNALSTLNGYDSYLSHSGRQALLDSFFSGDYQAARDAANVLEATTRIWDMIGKAHISKAIAPLAALLDRLEARVKNPISVPLHEIHKAGTDVEALIKLQIRVERFEAEFEEALETLSAIGMPSEWGHVEEAKLDSIDASYRDALNRLYADKSLILPGIDRLLSDLEGLLKRFRTMVEEAKRLHRDGSGAGSSGGRSGHSKRSKSSSGATDWGPISEAQARDFMGLPPTGAIDQKALKSRFRKMAKDLHPDLHRDKTRAKQAAFSEKMKKLNQCYDFLKDK